MPQRLGRDEDGAELPYLVWRLPAPTRVISSAVLGGGIGERCWILNAQVRAGYGRLDPARHLAELARAAGLSGAGVGLLTAADVDACQSVTDGGVRVDATVGVRVPTWAAWPEHEADPDLSAAPGTINIVAFVPATLTDAALVNLVATATEAKTQALLDAGIPGTGTATDAVCIIAGRRGDGWGGDGWRGDGWRGDGCPDDGQPPRARIDADADAELFGGPRSLWGARVARAVHGAVRAGTTVSLERMHPTGR